MTSETLTWVVAAATTAAVILRPFHWPEAIWAVAGAIVLIALHLLSPQEALAGVSRGTDVYLFLVGMMLLSETAREAGLFDWMAAHATRRANGSATRLFLLIYGVGTLVTIFLSNDATAVVLTPAVAAAARTAKVKHPLPYLLTCAFVANAASFVLPISNPANLVIYGSRMPSLLQWLPLYAAASVASIVVTYLMLRWTQRASLRQSVATDVPQPRLSQGGRYAAAGIAATAAALLAVSACDQPLGLPTALLGITTAAVVLFVERRKPWQTLRGISWSVLPLVAGLFVVVEALAKTGAIALLASGLEAEAARSTASASWAAGIAVAVASNLMNNLPVGLIAGSAVQAAHVPEPLFRAVLIGVDLGPNLSVSGSLATILWLAALRREGHRVSAVRFLALGCLVMPPALGLALAAAWLFG
ncbi:MAG: arsenic transporter [Proteobacteria bacterium]|nr:arsenic transporter [Pseudomonadota bacterium]